MSDHRIDRARSQVEVLPSLGYGFVAASFVVFLCTGFDGSPTHKYCQHELHRSDCPPFPCCSKQQQDSPPSARSARQPPSSGKTHTSAGARLARGGCSRARAGKLRAAAAWRVYLEKYDRSCLATPVFLDKYARLERVVSNQPE